MAGLLDYANEFLKGGKKYRDAVGGLLTGNTDGAKGLMGEVAQLFDPNYMRQIQSTAGRDGMDIALNANPMMASHTVYHGSPHTFDKFDMSKIGTGINGQAYGHGLYFAESPETARAYKVMKTDVPDQAFKIKYNIESAQARGDLQRVNELQNQLESLKSNEPGALYKVDIPDESIPKMLDWDKPLSEQHPDVQSALKQFPKKLANGRNFDEYDAQYINRMLDQKYYDKTVGGAVYKGLSSMFDNQGVLTNQANPAMNGATQYLKDIGITGIRYLDGNSRGNGGSSNFVVFDDSLPKILERNGQGLLK